MHPSDDLARQVRIDVVRMTNRGNSSHVASGLSIADILAVLYGRVMNFEASDPKSEQRDRFILSKGHAGAAVYATLAGVGFFERSLLETHCKNDSMLSGHVSHVGIPGVEFSTGSLGHGLGVAVGMALAMKKKSRNERVFVLMSDGECDEGSVWEAAMFASHHNLGRLTAIIDYNKLQSLKPVEETLRLEPLADKWRSFGWNVSEVNGHDHDALEEVFSERDSDEPKLVIAHTIKGRGVSFMENTVLWHYRSPQGEEFEAALKELGAI